MLIAAPVAVLALAIGDVGGLPEVFRYIVSPGFIFGLQAPSSGSWIGDISNALRIAIAGNEIYYGALVFVALSWLGRKRRATEGRSEQIVEQHR